MLDFSNTISKFKALIYAVFLLLALSKAIQTTAINITLTHATTGKTYPKSGETALELSAYTIAYVEKL